MRSVPLLDHTGLQQAPARDLLGPGHPLVLVMDRLAVVTERSSVVAALGAAGVVAQLLGGAFGLPTALAASAVLAVLGVQVFLLFDARRRQALRLIARGRADVPLGVIDRERRRLLDPRAVRPVSSELARGATLVRQVDADARGV